MFTLRPYQQDLEDRVRAAFRRAIRRVLLVAPTGSGKGVIFADIARKVHSKRKRIGIFVHRIELIDQVSRALIESEVPHGVIAAGHEQRLLCDVQIIGVQTYVRRLPRSPRFDLCIVDEAHHVVSGSTWAKALAHSPNARVLGTTATPQRLDSRGLRDSFDEMIVGPTVADLIAEGALAPYRLFAPAIPDLSDLHTRAGDYAKDEATAAMDKPTITGDALAQYRKHADGKRAIAFCCSVEHAKHVAATFREAGVCAASVDGTLDRELRAELMGSFAKGGLRVLTSCDLVSEGLDIQGIEVAILLRPTQSLALHLQQVGRALRPAPGKTALILDHVGNWQRHGLPDDPREWSLDGRVGSKRGAQDAGMTNRQCPKCYAVMRVGATVCPECGCTMEPKPRTVAEVEGELAEIDREQARQQRERRTEQGMAQSLEELIAIATKRGYKNPAWWAAKVLGSRPRRAA